jgi:hypothetical protein
MSLSATTVTNFSLPLAQGDSHFALNVSGLEFCNISIQYTHLGYDDTINFQVWLPLRDWNLWFMGTGGGRDHRGQPCNPSLFGIAWIFYCGY